MRQRFDAAESQLGEEAEEEEEAAAELSLNGMTERLGRLDAAKAFYAALGEAAGSLVWLAVPLGGRFAGRHGGAAAAGRLAGSRAGMQGGRSWLPPTLAAPPAPALPSPCLPAVARSHGFLQLEQQEPYGDIALRRGQYL